MTFYPPVDNLPPEEIVRLNDPETGLEGVIVLHSTRLGPAAGGCRLWTYATDNEALTDALRLAQGMSYKNVLAGLPFGGGKAVIRAPRESFDRAALFRAFGRAVASLDGRYVTAEDVGTTVEDMAWVAEETRHVAGLPAHPGSPGGDPSPWTALGTFNAMELAVERRLGRSLKEITVAVQGLGNVGFALCAMLHEAGARLLVAEPRADVAAKAAEMFGARVMDSRSLLVADADVLAPCALGGVLTAGIVRRVRAKVVCGAANNQLATAAEGDELAARGILYAPDYVVNAGGIINVAAEYFAWDEREVRRRVGRIGATLKEVLELASTHDVAPSAAADLLARSRIALHQRLAA